MIKALMTNEKRPKVMMFKGNPKIDKMGRTKKLSKAKTMAKMTAVPKLEI